MRKVVLYGTRFCPYCVAARHLLKAKSVAFDDIPVDGNSALRRQVMARSGRDTVPQIWIGDTHVGGYDELRALEAADELDTLLCIDGDSGG
ncbi:MAG: glutaredoxin 3 [Porticoccaceae bacterium]